MVLIFIVFLVTILNTVLSVWSNDLKGQHAYIIGQLVGIGMVFLFRVIVWKQ